MGFKKQASETESTEKDNHEVPAYNKNDLVCHANQFKTSGAQAACSSNRYEIDKTTGGVRQDKS
jgi:hypothetical protein